MAGNDTHGVGAPPMALVGKYGESAPEPPPSAAGFTHRTCRPFVALCADWMLTPCPGIPNRLSLGGWLGNDEYAITQPDCVGDEHPGIFVKVPPVSRPLATVTLPPSTIAETMRLRSVALLSTWLASSRISIAAPCECPMNTTGRPPLSWAR